MGRETGANRGRGGSMHVADPELGILGANGIVGAGLPIAVGAAFGLTRQRPGSVAVCFFGDGAIATGAFHEAVNLAALWRLPVVFFCENNQYSEFSRAQDQHPVPVSQRAVGYGLPFVKLAGNDVEAVAGGMAPVLEGVRAGGGPVLVEGVTLRVRGHYEGDPQRYRESPAPDDGDPIAVVRRALIARGIDEDRIGGVEREATETVDDAEDFARRSPVPDPDTSMDFVTAPRHPEPARLAAPTETVPDLAYSRGPRCRTRSPTTRASCSPGSTSPAATCSA
jgi:2-oxoisovalerate dehydrogenase E1 component